MVEYATLTATVAILTASLGTLQQRVADRVATSNAAAVQQAVIRARAVGAPAAGARAAYAAAPYRAPALHYVYSVGWSAGTKHRTLCLLGRLDPTGTEGSFVRAFRSSKDVLREVRKLHLTALTAGRAFARGFLSSCA